jgi:hypothetical protein
MSELETRTRGLFERTLGISSRPYTYDHGHICAWGTTFYECLDDKDLRMYMSGSLLDGKVIRSKDDVLSAPHSRFFRLDEATLALAKALGVEDE